MRFSTSLTDYDGSVCVRFHALARLFPYGARSHVLFTHTHTERLFWKLSESFSSVRPRRLANKRRGISVSRVLTAPPQKTCTFNCYSVFVAVRNCVGGKTTRQRLPARRVRRTRARTTDSSRAKHIIFNPVRVRYTRRRRARRIDVNATDEFSRRNRYDSYALVRPRRFSIFVADEVLLWKTSSEFTC